MKKPILICLFIITFCCNHNDEPNTNCNFLFDAAINLVVNTNLPQFSQLQFPNNGVYVAGQGNNGIWLWSFNSTTILAWDAADPSRPPESCSKLIGDGNGIVVSTCDDENRYALATGQGLQGNTSPCTLKPYRVNDLGGGQYLVSN